jgi:tetratricopeptide (TPR) repeat protein
MEDRLKFATTLMEKAIVFRRLGDLQGAIGLYHEALEIIQPLTGTEAQSSEALILQNLSNVIEDTGNYGGSLEPLEKAIFIWQQLIEDDQLYRREDLVSAYQAMSNKLTKLGSLEEAHAWALHALELYKQLFFEEGRDDLAQDMGRLLSSTGIILQRLFRPREAVPFFELALKVFERTPPSLRSDQAGSARNVIEQRIMEIQELLNAKPNDFERWIKRAEELVDSGQTLDLAGDTFHACDMYDEAIGIYMQLYEIAGEPRFLAASARTSQYKGVSAVYAGRAGAALSAFRLATNLYDKLLDDYNRHELIEPWARTHLASASFYRRYGDEASAESLVNKMKERLKSLDATQHARWSKEADRVLTETWNAPGE